MVATNDSPRPPVGRGVRLERDTSDKQLHAGGTVTYRVYIDSTWVGWVGDGREWRGHGHGARRWWAAWRQDGDACARWNGGLNYATRTIGLRALLAEIGKPHQPSGQDLAGEPGLDRFAADILDRCRWAVARNDGHPSGAWSTGEQLAVALVLRDTAQLRAMEYSTQEAAQRVWSGMANAPKPEDFPGWLARIRTALGK